MTNLGPDVTDMVLEQIDATGYFVDGEHKPFTVIEDVIKVAGGDDVPITIRSTEHGPLMSDVGETEQMIAEDAPAAAGSPTDGDEYGVAYRWTALEPGRTVESIIQLARMSNWEDFRAAAANWAVPAQNLAYADAEGNIGYQTPGSIPVRRGYSGKYPVPGWDSAYGWDGYIPFDALPNMYNPDSGLVVTANNAAIGDQYPYLLTDDWDYGYRAQRITDLLEQATTGSATVDGAGLSAIQLDTYSAVAADLVPRMQASVSGLDEQTAAAFALFDGWDFHADKDSAAAAYFNAFWRTLQDPLYNDELGPDARSNGGDRWWYVTDALWDRPDDPWWDDTTTPEHGVPGRDDRRGPDRCRRRADGTVRKLTRQSGPGARCTPSRWWRTPSGRRGSSRWSGSSTGARWSSAEAAASSTPSAGTRRCRARARMPTSHSAPTRRRSNRRTTVNWIPSYRSVTDFADYDRSTWVHLTGASGHTYNAHYDDQLELWATGQTLPWAFTQAAVEAAAEDTLTLNPAG